MHAHELWETESGNLMASFPTEAQALAAVAEQIRQYGPSSVATIALALVNDSNEAGDFEQIAAGPELVQLSHGRTRHAPRCSGEDLTEGHRRSTGRY
ncbi:MAG: hypothetical protein IT306_00705 [Chloroflexi bacterium]|nr:hypothetical protein [Chloroflexota bacterium]